MSDNKEMEQLHEMFMKGIYKVVPKKHFDYKLTAEQEKEMANIIEKSCFRKKNKKNIKQYE